MDAREIGGRNLLAMEFRQVPNEEEDSNEHRFLSRVAFSWKTANARIEY